MPVFHTPSVRVACAICYDIWFPEVFGWPRPVRRYPVRATNWVPMPAQPGRMPLMATCSRWPGRIRTGYFVAAANRVGVERGQPFLGCSLIVDLTGGRPPARQVRLEQEIMVAGLESGGRPPEPAIEYVLITCCGIVGRRY